MRLQFLASNLNQGMEKSIEICGNVEERKNMGRGGGGDNLMYKDEEETDQLHKLKTVQLEGTLKLP